MPDITQAVTSRAVLKPGGLDVGRGPWSPAQRAGVCTGWGPDPKAALPAGRRLPLGPSEGSTFGALLCSLPLPSPPGEPDHPAGKPVVPRLRCLLVRQVGGREVGCPAVVAMVTARGRLGHANCGTQRSPWGGRRKVTKAQRGGHPLLPSALSAPGLTSLGAGAAWVREAFWSSGIGSRPRVLPPLIPATTPTFSLHPSPPPAATELR